MHDGHSVKFCLLLASWQNVWEYNSNGENNIYHFGPQILHYPVLGFDAKESDVAFHRNCACLLFNMFVPSMISMLLGFNI